MTIVVHSWGVCLRVFVHSLLSRPQSIKILTYLHDGETELHACELDGPIKLIHCHQYANDQQQRKIEGLKLGQVVAKDLVGLPCLEQKS